MWTERRSHGWSLCCHELAPWPTKPTDSAHGYLVWACLGLLRPPLASCCCRALLQRAAHPLQSGFCQTSSPPTLTSETLLSQAVPDEKDSHGSRSASFLCPYPTIHKSGVTPPPTSLLCSDCCPRTLELACFLQQMYVTLSTISALHPTL